MTKRTYEFGFKSDENLEDPDLHIAIVFAEDGNLIKQIGTLQLASRKLLELVVDSMDSDTLSEARGLLDTEEK